MQTDNKAAYEAIVASNNSFREALKIAADSPIPAEVWNEYGRAMQLQERIRVALKPKA